MGSLYKRSGSANWQAAWIDHNGKRCVRSTRTSNKSSAAMILAKWEADAAVRAAGVIDPIQERIAESLNKPISQHLRDFERSLASPGNTDKHVEYTLHILETVFADQSIRSLRDLRQEVAERHAEKLRSLKRANRTIGRHLQALKQFAKWCVKTSRLSVDLFASIALPSAESDRRLERRALIPCSASKAGEWPYLRDAATAGQPFKGMHGKHRAILYELAIQTGLRQNECRELTTSKLYLDQAKPYVLLPSRSTKNRRPARQYIGTALRDTMLAYVGQRPSGRVFDLPDETELANMLRLDLASARLSWLEASDTPAERRLRASSDFLLPENADGKVLDFHALRHTCGAWLAHAGENPKTIQSIMRHSSITLTMDTYGHLFPDTAAAAIDRIEGMLALTLAPEATESDRKQEQSI